MTEAAPAPPGAQDRPPTEGCSAVMRGFIAMVFLVLAAACNGLWLLTTAATRELGRDVLVDPLAAPLLAGMALALVAIPVFWSAFGRALTMATALLTAAHAAVGVLVAMASAAVVGRPGGAVGVTAWPVLAALLAGLALLVVATGQGAPRRVQRWRLLGATAVTTLGVAATGARPIDLVVTGPGRWPALQPVVDHLAWALVGLAVALVALAPLRAGRTVALGQALAALVFLGAPQLGTWTWLARQGSAVDPTVSLATAAAALVVAAATAGPRHHLDDVAWQPPELVQRAAARLWGRPDHPPAAPAPPPPPSADPDATAVIDDRDGTGDGRGDETAVIPVDRDDTRVL